MKLECYRKEDGMLNMVKIKCLPLKDFGFLFSLLFFSCGININLGFLGSPAGKEFACIVGDLGSIPGLERSPGGRHGNPLQYSGLENPMDCIGHGVTESNTTEWLSLHSVMWLLEIFWFLLHLPVVGPLLLLFCHLWGSWGHFLLKKDSSLLRTYLT